MSIPDSLSSSEQSSNGLVIKNYDTKILVVNLALILTQLFSNWRFEFEYEIARYHTSFLKLKYV